MSVTRCCICHRSVEDDRVAMFKFPGTPSACHEHIREAIERSDGIKPTDEEWEKLLRRVLFELEDLATSGEAKA